MMEVVQLEKRGDSLFSNQFRVDEKSILHKQIEFRGDFLFFRLRKRTFKDARS